MADELQTTLDAIDDLLAQGDLDAAESAVDAALESHGPSGELYVLRAEVALEKEDYTECVTSVQDALSNVDDDATRGTLLSTQGYAHFYLNELEKARACFNQAVRLTEGLGSALIGRAMVHEELRFLRAALLDLNRAIELDDREGQPFAIRGTIQMIYGNLDEARSDLQQAINLDPDDEESRLNLARLEATAKNTAAAIEILEPLVEDGNDPDMVIPAALLRSQLSLTLGSSEAAAEDAQKAIDLDPDAPWGFLQLAACHLTAMNAGNALETLKEAEARVKDLRDAPDILALRASAYDQLDKPEKAAEIRAQVEGSAQLPSIVYGEILNPAHNIPLNPAKPIDVRALITQLFGSADNAPPGYEEAVRNVIAKLPELVQQNPQARQLRIQLPKLQGMTNAPSLVIQVNPNAGNPTNA